MTDLPLSSTGAELDPEDMRPVFGYIDGVPHSRRRWLAATKDERRAAIVDALKADANLPAPPSTRDDHDTWIAYATSQGVTDAASRTKKDLMSIFGDVVTD